MNFDMALEMSGKSIATDCGRRCGGGDFDLFRRDGAALPARLIVERIGGAATESTFDIAEDEMVGVAIRGEPGRRRVKLQGGFRDSARKRAPA